ncbi:MAG: hypothetical protein Q7T00_06665 [Rugosibacter sp.]|nr:hypothetical protein [Rugosibacter sp.]
MKIKTLALAISALSAGAANAAYVDNATNVYLTGASAIRNNVAASIKKQCTAAGGSLTVFKNGSSTSSLANQMAYVCSTGLAGTSITTVYHTVTGGSLNSILGMSNDVAKQQIPVNIASGTCAAAVAGTGALLGYSVRANCANEAVASPSDGGWSDVEYAPVREQVDILTAGTDGFTIDDVAQTATNVAQAFGVGVSEKMYKDLQAAQGIACTAGDPAPACQPSLNKADIVSLINSNTFAPHKNGAQALGLTSGATVEYARRVTTSGTQSSAQVLFLGKGCLAGVNGGELPVIGDDVLVGTTNTYNGGLFKVSANSGTGDVITKLTNAGATNYAFGWVSAENRAPTTTTGWKFIKLNGVAISDGTSTGLNKQNAIDGKYDSFVEAVSYKGPSAKTDTNEGTVIDAISNGMATIIADGGAETVGMFILPENAGGYTHDVTPTEVSNFQRGGSSPNSCAPVVRNQ